MSPRLEAIPRPYGVSRRTLSPSLGQEPRPSQLMEVSWGLTFIGAGVLLVTERPGRIRLVDDGALVDEPAATIPATARGEGGLLGLAANPHFSANRLFYIYFEGATRLLRVGGVPRHRCGAHAIGLGRGRAAHQDVGGESSEQEDACGFRHRVEAGRVAHP